jgi:hypothetical protein
MGLDLYEIDLPWLGRPLGESCEGGRYVLLSLGFKMESGYGGERATEGGDGDGKRWRRREGVWRMEMERPRVQSTP